MAALSEDRSFALNCGQSSDRVTVFHVKLTEAALGALHSFKEKNWKEPSLQPTIQFKGLQGIVKIPRSDSETQTFDFYLSNVTKDNPQGSFECLRQQSGSGAPSLSQLAPVQNKLTVCATNESCHVTKPRVTPAAEDPKERAPKVHKHEGQSRMKQVAARKPRPSTADVVPERKRSTPQNLANTLKKCLTNNPVSQRPLRDRVLHLLALRAYKKLELLARLQRDGLSQKDRASLGSTLQQVAVLNPKENTFSLRDFLFREVQRDWPGFSDEERSTAQRNVTRKLGLSSDASISSPKGSAPCPSPKKRQLPDGDFIDPLAPKKPRISHLSHRTSSTSPEEHRRHGATSTAPSSSVSSLSSVPRAAPHQLSPSSAPFHSSSAPSHSPSTPEGCGTQDLPRDQSSSCQDLNPSPSRNPSPLSSDHGNVGNPGPSDVLKKPKKKSKKHKDKDRGEARRAPPGGEGSARRKDKKRRDEQPTVPKATDSSERQVPDYLLKYHPLVSLEQRQQYKDDFNSEYEEYRSLHAQVESITRRFSQLDRRCKSLTPGSTEHQNAQDEVLREYKKIKQHSPYYQEQKQRCEYLHNKLAHIKRLISDYDRGRAPGWS